MEQIKIQCTEAQLRLIAAALAVEAYRSSAFSRDMAQNGMPNSADNSRNSLEEIKAHFERTEPPRWRAEPGDSYWYVDSVGAPYCETDDGDDIGDHSYYWDCGNYFKTEAEAEAMAAKWRELFAPIDKGGDGE